MSRDERIRQLYHRDLQEKFDRDVADYEAASLKVCGLGIKEVAERYSWAWDLYEADRDLERVARGVGASPERVLQALRAQQAAGILDPVLAGLLHGEPLRFEHYEESLSTLHLYLRGLKP